MLWRQGDIFIARADSIPAAAIKQSSGVLAEGELTGHRHRVEQLDGVMVYEHRGELYLDVEGEQAAVVHEEHGTIPLPRGKYRVWRQREYDPVLARQDRHRLVMD